MSLWFKMSHNPQLFCLSRQHVLSLEELHVLQIPSWGECEEFSFFIIGPQPISLSSWIWVIWQFQWVLAWIWVSLVTSMRYAWFCDLFRLQTDRLICGLSKSPRISLFWPTFRLTRFLSKHNYLEYAMIVLILQVH